MPIKKIIQGKLNFPEEVKLVNAAINGPVRDFCVIAEKSRLMPPLVVGIEKNFKDLTMTDLALIQKKACSCDGKFMYLFLFEQLYDLINNGREIDIVSWNLFPHFGLFPLPEEGSNLAKETGIFIEWRKVTYEI